jgi:hypothetical protein
MARKQMRIRLLELIRKTLAGYGFPDSDETGKYTTILSTRFPHCDNYETIIVRPQSNNGYLLEQYEYYEHNAGDIPFWENSEYKELPEPWWQEKKLASVPIRSFEKLTPREEAQIDKQFLTKIHYEFERKLRPELLEQPR